jgi:glutamate-1-semialdehyde 2,1-aminomutase
MENKCKEIVRKLRIVIDEKDLGLQINHVASMFQVFFTEKPVYDYETAKTADNKKFMLYQRRLLDQGIFIPPSQWETCFLSSEHSEQDIERTIEVAGETIDLLKNS